MKRLEDCLLAVENPDGKAQRCIFKRKRGGKTLTREQLKAIKVGRKLLKAELKERGLTTKEDLDVTASSMGLYLDKSRWFLWLRWLFFGRGAWILIGAAMALMAVLFALAVISQLRGHFTVNMSSGMFQEGFILSEEVEFKNPTTHLFCTPSENVPCISISHIPTNIDQIDGQHNDAYFAYTFYIRNEGQSTVGYEWTVSLNSESRDLSSATWVMVFEDGQMLFYAKPDENGAVQALPGFDDSDRGYLDLHIKDLCRDADSQFEVIKQERGFSYYRVIPFSFESDSVVARGNQSHVVPGDVHKYTVVIWLEGDDPDCTDELIGGHVGMDFNFRLDTEEERDGGAGNDSSWSIHWDELWDNLLFWLD